MSNINFEGGFIMACYTGWGREGLISQVAKEQVTIERTLALESMPALWDVISRQIFVDRRRWDKPWIVYFGHQLGLVFVIVVVGILCFHITHIDMIFLLRSTKFAWVIHSLMRAWYLFIKFWMKYICLMSLLYVHF